MINVLFICLGNICRSPLAEGIFKNLVGEMGLSSEISCDSAGTSGWHIGEPPDRRSEAVAAKYGITLDHYGRQLEADDFRTFDYLIAMDKSNYQNIKAAEGFEEFPEDNLLMMRDFDSLGKGKDVPDPYFGGNDGFEDVYDMLKRSCENLLDHLVEKHNVQ